MLRFFRKLSFKKKILSSYILFIGISCLLIGVYCIRSMDATKKENYNYMSQFGEQISLNTDVIFSNMERIRYIHLIDDEVKKSIRKSMKQKTIGEELEETAYVQKALNHMTAMNQYVLRATIVNEYGEIYSNVQTRNESYIKRMEEIDAGQDWSDKHKVYYTGVYTEEINMIPFELVTSISKIYDIDRDTYVGTLYVDVNFAFIRKILNQSLQTRKTGMELLIFDANQNVLYETKNSGENFQEYVSDKEQEEIRKFLDGKDENHLLSIGGRRCIVSSVKNSTTNWKIMTYTPLRFIYASGWKNMVGILSAMLILLIAAIVLGIILAGQISRPVTILAKAMSRVKQGKVQLIDESQYYWQDEMRRLLLSYNEMGRRINESIEKIYVYQLNKKQTELKMLQLQINPHFLYNTLNTISSIAALEDIEEIAQIADNLSGMFQYSIKGEDMVPVSREMQHVKSYLEIQAIRFPGKYEFYYDIKEDVSGQKMLKFLIQPLVENALQHGFEDREGINCIWISADMSPEHDIYIKIRDNGVGIGQKKTENLNDELENMDAGILVQSVDHGIGLRNVNARIKNFYGRDYGVHIESQEGSYTEIIIKIKSLDSSRQEETEC